MENSNLDNKASRDAIPAANLSVLRGRGPRRGNLEKLLDYWRPIMKKPGGFRRCLVILADHPELYPLEPLCAWLHHETTGKWPNEGNRKPGGGGRRGRRGRRRILRRRKKFDSVIVTNKLPAMSGPIMGPNSVNFKAEIMARSRANLFAPSGFGAKVGLVSSNTVTGRALQSAGSFLLPGDLGDIRHPVRSTIYEALTPGGRGVPGRSRRGGIGFRRRGGGARNKFRCPPGFEKGGTFTNSAFSTCGRQILRIPSLETGGPGSLSPDAEATVRRLATDADLVRSIGDLRRNRSALDIIRAAQIPPAPKEVDVPRRQSSVDLILAAIAENPDTSVRVVRRDGIILEPAVGLADVAGLGEFDDLNDGALVVSDATRAAGQQIGIQEVPTLRTGVRGIVWALPGLGAVSLRREGGDLSETERDALVRQWTAAVNAVGRSDDPTAAIRRFADNSDGRYVIDVALNDADVEAVDRELVTVTRRGQELIVPRWVYQTYLSRNAPRRPQNQQPYILLEEKSLVQSPFSLGNARRPIKLEPEVDYQAEVQSWRDHIDDLQIGTKSAIRKARAVWDPTTENFICPPGTSNAGKPTDKFGRTCGLAMPEMVIAKLVTFGQQLSEMGAKEVNGGLDASDASTLAGLVKELMNESELVNSVVANKASGKDLSKEDMAVLTGLKLAIAMRQFVAFIDSQNYASQASVEEVQEAFKAISEAATAEARRLTVAPARSKDTIAIKGAIQSMLMRLVERIDAPVRNVSASASGEEEPIQLESSDIETPLDLADERPEAPKPTRKFSAALPRIERDSETPDPKRIRREAAPMPELTNLTGQQREAVASAMVEAYEELEEIWEERLGTEEFNLRDLSDWIKARKDKDDGEGVPLTVWKRRLDDWAELDEWVLANDAAADLADIVGRLSLARRESIVMTADLSGKERMQRQRDIRNAGFEAETPDNGPTAAELRAERRRKRTAAVEAVPEPDPVG